MSHASSSNFTAATTALKYANQFYAILIFAYQSGVPLNFVIKSEVGIDTIPKTGEEYLSAVRARTLETYLQERRLEVPQITIEELANETKVSAVDVAYTLNAREWFSNTSDEQYSTDRDNWYNKIAASTEATKKYAEEFIESISSISYSGSYELYDTIIKDKKIKAVPFIKEEAKLRELTEEDALRIFNRSKVSEKVQLVGVTTLDAIRTDETEEEYGIQGRKGIFKVLQTLDPEIIDEKKYGEGSLHALIVLPSQRSMGTVPNSEASASASRSTYDEPEYVHVEIKFEEIEEKKPRKKKGNSNGNGKEESVEIIVKKRVSIQFSLPGGTDCREVFSALEESMGIIVTSFEETDINGEFKLKGCSYEESTLFYFIVNDPVVSHLLHSTDNKKPWPASKTLSLRLTGSGITFEMKSIKAYTGGRETPDSFYISVVFKKAFDHTDVTRLKRTLSSLMKYYNELTLEYIVPDESAKLHFDNLLLNQEALGRDVRDELDISPEFGLAMYSSNEEGERVLKIRQRKYLRLLFLSLGGTPAIPRLLQGSSNETQEGPGDDMNPRARLTELKRLAPELYNYPKISRRIAPEETRPKIIAEDQKSYWESTRGRVVVRWPEQDGRLYVCPDESYKYPGRYMLAISQYESIEVVKCFKESKLNPDGTMRPAKEKSKRSRASNILATLALVEDGRMGNLPEIVNTSVLLATQKAKAMWNGNQSNGVLQVGSAPPEIGHLYRKGFANRRSMVSLIHSVLTAIEHREYILADDPIRKENFALVVFEELKRKYSNLIKQELWEEVPKHPADADGRVYFRAIEEHFQINLYMFNVDGPVMPRSRYYPIRFVEPSRRAVCVFLNMGTKADMRSDFPHYELIVGSLEDGSFVTSFHPYCNTALYGSFKDKLSFVFSNISKLVFGYPRDILRPSLSAQYIDSYGKLRALYYANNSRMIITFPSPPLNLPILRKKVLCTSNTAKEMIQILGKQVEKVSVSNGSVVGYWFARGFLYIPIHPSPMEPFEQLTEPKLSFSQEEEGEAMRFRRLKKISEFLEQILKHGFWLKRQDDEPLLTIERFFDECCIVSDGEYEADEVRYDIVRPTFELFMRTLSQYSTSFVQMSMFRIPRESLKVKLISMMKQWLSSLQGMSGLRQPTRLRGEFQTVSDFNLENGVRVFYGIDALKSSLGKVSEFNLASETIDISHLERDPVPVKIGNKFYLLQRVRGGSAYSAYAVSKKWEDEAINPGFNCAPYLGELSNVKYWTLTEEETIVPADNTEGKYNILAERMGVSNSYSALLSIST